MEMRMGWFVWFFFIKKEKKKKAHWLFCFKAVWGLKLRWYNKALPVSKHKLLVLGRNNCTSRSSLRLGKVLPLQQQHSLGWGAPGPEVSADNTCYYCLLIFLVLQNGSLEQWRHLRDMLADKAARGPAAGAHAVCHTGTLCHPRSRGASAQAGPGAGRAHTNRNPPRPPPPAHADAAKTGPFGVTRPRPATTTCQHPGIKGEKSTAWAARGFAGLISSRSCWRGQPLQLCLGIGCFYFTKSRQNAG